MRTGYTKLLFAACLGCTAYNMAAAQKAPTSSIPTLSATSIQLRFVNTDVSDVLQAISVQAHANIVFPAQLKKLISINLAADSTKNALSFVAAAGGLAFRYASGTYVVALPTDLRQALEPFGEQSSVTLKVLPSDQAVKLVEGAFPYLTARPAGSKIMLIGANEDIANAITLLQDQDSPESKDPYVSEIEAVQYSSAAQLASMVKSLYPTLKAEPVGPTDKKGGAIGLFGPKSQVESAKQSLIRADLPIGLQNPEAVYRVYPIRFSSAPILQIFMTNAAPNILTIIGPDPYAPEGPSYNPISGASLGGGSGGSSGGGSVSTSSSSGSTGGSGGAGGSTSTTTSTTSPVANALRSKFLVLRGTPPDLDAAVKLLEQVDVAPRQVMIEVKVIDTSPDDAEQLGLAYQYSTLGLFGAPSGTAVSTNPPAVSAGTTISHPFSTFSALPLGLSATLNAITTHSESKILANPRIQVLDNDSASIFIGQTISIELSSSGALGSSTNTVQQFPVGIILLVRPRVNADGKITMLVHPVVSTVTSTSSDGLPQTNSREAETTVMVNDGETVVIGGLIQDEMTKEVDSIPFLSKLPLIGELFKNRSKDHSHTEVMVFITPHLLKQ